MKRPESRQGTFSQQLEEMTRLHDRLAENGLEFSLGLHQMHDELSEMANRIEKGRKHWKQVGINSTKKVYDAEQLAEKVQKIHILLNIR